MERLRIVLLIIAIIIIIAQLIIIDYNNLAWGENAGSYLSILSMMFLIMSVFMSMRAERRKNKA